VGLCSLVKKNPATAHIPILFLSGDGHLGKVEEALAQGGDGYVVKPFDLARLVEKIRQTIR
jgi:DNA-binding response OmpR family regulator